MFASAEVGAQVGKEEFDAAVPRIRVDLLNAQFDLRDAPFSVLILLAGDDRLGCDEVVDLLNEWMDGRYLENRFFGRPTDEELMRPRFWRYWRALPPKGRTGLFIGGWTENAIIDRVRGDIDDEGLDRRIHHARQIEENLAANGTLLLKIWLHLPRKELKKRLKKAREDPEKGWRVDEREQLIYDYYKKAMPICEQLLRRTETAHAPWQVIESTDRRYRDLTVARLIRDSIVARLAAVPATPTSQVAVPATAAGDALGAVDLDLQLDYDEYREKLRENQARLRRRVQGARAAGQSSVLVFEGWDAAGKGGAIRRVTRAIHARDYQVIAVAAPTEEELARHYLWRFWRHLPRSGIMTIFDRSWYGRVLVERIEGLTPENQWRRAYSEINDFEAQLVEHGIAVFKFWLHVDPEEQLRRFKAREKTPFKKHKITDEDYRNRERWDDYVAAVNEMVARTSTEIAPWTLVPANDKRYARIQVLETVNKGLKRAMK
jgi:polyphosphate:AMP phosphotransferase